MVIINYVNPYVVVSASCLLSGIVKIYSGERLLAQKKFEKENMVQIKLPNDIETNSIKVIVSLDNGKQVNKTIKMSSNLTSF